MAIKRIFIECTHTYYAGHNSGIQRGVRGLANYGPAAGREEGVECQAVVWSLWGVLRIDRMTPAGKEVFRWAMGQREVWHERVRGWKHRLTWKMRHWGERTPPLPPAPAEPSRKVALVYQTIYMLATGLCHPPWQALTHRVRLGRGDAVLLADASWNQPMWASLARAKGRGARVGMLVHDWLPVTNPEWFDGPLVRRFERWVDAAITTCTFYVGNSRATQAEVAKVLAARGRTMPGGWFHWGAAERFAPRSAVSAPRALRPESAEIFSNERAVCLMVGTIEPRKNHILALDAFDQLWAEHSEAALFIVGKPGWECRRVVERIRAHGQHGRRLFWRVDVSDEELDDCYARTKLLLVPSHAEGFGLPITEALSRGVAVVCSDIPVFREVGGAHCTYVAPGDAGAWASAIARGVAEERAVAAQRVAGFQTITWNESCRALLAQVKALADAGPAA